MPLKRVVLLASVLGGICATTVAQNTGNPFTSPPPQVSQPAYFYIAKPGEITMQINLWGDVEKPGRYEVPINTDLVQLISLAGGPTREANLSEVQISRYSKTSGGVIKQQVTVNLEDFFKTDDAKLALQPGDQIYINFVTRINIRDIFTLVGVAALVVGAAAQLSYARRP